MTVFTIDDPNDTGEIPRPVGETRTRIDTGEKTERIDPDTIKMIVEAPSFRAIPRGETLDITTEVPLIAPPLGLSHPRDLQGPPKPVPAPPPQPRPAIPPKYDPETAVLSLLGSVAGVDGELRMAPLPRPATPIHIPKPKPKLRRSVPYVLPADRAPWSGPRHAAPPPLWTRLAIAVGLAMVLGATVGLIALAVIQ